MSMSCVQNAGQSHNVKVAVYQSTQRKFPNEFNLQQLRCQILESNSKISNTYCENVAEFKCFGMARNCKHWKMKSRLNSGKGTDRNLFFFVGMKLGFSH